MRYRLPLFLLILLASLIACQEPVPAPPLIPTMPPPTHLWLGVTDDAAALLNVITTSYPEDDIVIHLVSGNSRVLYDDVISGQLDAAFLHFIPAGNELWFNPVSLDGLVMIVHPSNSVQQLTRAQAQAVFSGRVTNWFELGGADGPIQTYNREHGAGSRLLLQERIMQEQRVVIAAELQPSYAAMIEAVAADPQGIGYTTLSGLSAEVAIVTIEGVRAEPNTVGTQQYPLTAPLYFLTDGEPQAELRAFLGWLQSVETQQQLGQAVGRVR